MAFSRPSQSFGHWMPIPKVEYTPIPTATRSVTRPFAKIAGKKKLPRSVLVSAPLTDGEKVDLLVTNTAPAEACTPPMNARLAGLNQTAAGSSSSALTAEARAIASPEMS